MIYQQGKVSVDQHFARFGSKSYAIDKINSVDVRIDKKNSNVWMLFAICALMALTIGFKSIGGWAVILVFSVIAFLTYRNQPAPVYHLMLATSSGEIQATSAGDRDAIADLRNAIESAMTQKV
ncbi:DUF6232 family protein [Novosphingobium sp. P6W]|uniref:DUF6232 family protein n=1 Tax=Novosphingobium sp. P6W TaxID=1609758 RepID=UPI0005C320E3|nr:DUF6232 family protein [Novosphingobium sp. P6W]AXB75456.1 hypothetical protein TQ38_002130 [Novosphingobium sp. P6W]KIS32517.1 hypothetical protein TQ38_09280 [Novosphingobium sp. P6W]